MTTNHRRREAKKARRAARLERRPQWQRALAWAERQHAGAQRFADAFDMRAPLITHEPNNRPKR